MTHKKHDTEPSFIISPTWIIPVVPDDTLLEDYSLVIKDNIIVDLLSNIECEQKYPHCRRKTLPNHIVIPGLINAHGHAAMTLLRGYADDLKLMDWLNNHIWPVESAWVDYNFVYDGTSLAIAEMISTGTTCAADAYFFPDAAAQAFADNNFRCQVSMPLIEFPNAWAKTETEHIKKGIEVHHANTQNSLINTAFAPHAPYSVSDSGFEAALEACDSLNIPMHLHLHETKQEVEDALRERKTRPIQRMYDLGVLSSSLQAVHMTQLNNNEIELIAQHGVNIAHCPDSNLKLASGFCPTAQLQAAGINVAVGTDGVASNNNLDMLAEIRSAALLAKAYSKNATCVSAKEALAMGTINSAKLLGLDHQIGSLEIGKLADIVAVDLSAPNFQPVHNPLSQLIYSATGHQVTHSWINGKQVLSAGKLCEMDLPKLMSNINQWHRKIRK